jgi:hypothetical protein
MILVFLHFFYWSWRWNVNTILILSNCNIFFIAFLLIYRYTGLFEYDENSSITEKQTFSNIYVDIQRLIIQKQLERQAVVKRRIRS